MICGPCTRGDHCNSASCFCQHRPRKHSSCDHPLADHEPGRGCTHTGCPCLWKAQEQGQPGALAPSGAFLVPEDLAVPARESQGCTADPDLYVSPGFNRVVQDVPVVELLADWMRAVRGGRKARAAVLHGALRDRLGRLK